LPEPAEIVMPGLDPGIHLFLRKNKLFVKSMDCRVKPGNDGGWVNVTYHPSV
jgi:hypothetical protein